MKVFKYIIILFLIIIIGGSIYFSLKDGSYNITEKRTIAAPPEVLYEQIEDFSQWENWNPWLEEENVTSTMGTQTKGVDAYYTFTDEYGKGKMTIKGIEPNSSILMDMYYDNSMTTSNSNVTMKLNEVENGTEVIWNIQGEQGLLDKIIAAAFGFKMEEEIQPKYEKGLENLEKVAKEKMNLYTINVDGIIEAGGGYFLYMSSSSKLANVAQLKTQMLQNIMSYMQRNNIDLYGMPRVIYETIDQANNSTIFSAAVPVQNREITATGSNILSSYREPTKTVKITLKGSYDHINEAWKKGEEFIAQNGLIRSELPIYEIYKTNPELTPNPANYLTEIYIPIQ